MKWRPADHDAVGLMLAKKMSARDIALHFGVTRNAVIGMVHRSKALSAVGFANEFRGVPNKPRTPKPPPGTPRFIPLVELRRGECRWPCNDAAHGEPHLFCGNPAELGKPYCRVHWLRSLGKGTPSERGASRELRRAYPGQGAPA